MSMMTGVSPNIPMDRDERIKRFGIECIGPAGDGILFKAGHWRPGGEYIQKLLIRNVSTEVKKLKYKLPSTRYFSLAYPEPIILSPGLFTEVDVVFRPVEYEPYDDTIYIKMLDGISGNGFHIPVRATIDKLSLVVPPGLDLGYCPTHQTTEIKFHLVNDGEIDAPYIWEVPPPFVFEPSEGTIHPGAFHEITVSLVPMDASVFVAKAICRVGEGVHAIIPNPVLTLKLSAIGKFTFLTLSEGFISFGEVVSGMASDTKETVLQNTSLVPAEFELVRLDNDRDEVFDVTPKKGIIPPRSEVPVLIKYSALAMGCYTLDRYAYRTPSNCNIILTLQGLTMPPKVSLIKDVAPAATTTLTTGSSLSEEGSPLFSLNFRDIEIGKMESRIIFLSNESAREVTFSIMGDEHGIFKMLPKQGTIPPLIKSYAVKVIFIPVKPINYYRRFFVLVGDALPLFYDCLGTGFIRAKGEVKEQRPAPIRHAHVQAYRNRSVEGKGGCTPEELDELYEQPDANMAYFAQIGRIGTKAMSITSLQRPITRTGDTIRNLVAPAHEFFIEQTDATAKEVTLNSAKLDFGFTQYHDLSAPQTVTIHNHTNGKVAVQWYIPTVKGMTIDLSKTRGGDREIITADRNEKEIEALQAFSVSPMLSEINSGQSMSYTIVFCPKQSSRNFLCELEAYVYFKNQRTFRLVNDFSLVPPWCLTVSAMGHTFQTGQLLAKGVFSGGNINRGKLVFPCCYYGECLYQIAMLRNTSDLPCTFQLQTGWGQREAHSDDLEVFQAKPSVGEIAENDFILICFRFRPADKKKYTECVRLFINGEESGKLLLEGCGALPYLVVPELLEERTQFPEESWGIPSFLPRSIPKGLLGDVFLKPTSLGLFSTRQLTLKNASRLPLKFKVCLPIEDGECDASVLTISPMHGVLRGNDSLNLLITFTPKDMKLYKVKLSIDVLPIAGKSPRVLDSNQPGAVAAPELLQSISMTILGQGEIGALTFSPPECTMDVRLVHTSEQRSLLLENVSDSDLSYQLFYKETFMPDRVDEDVVERTTEMLPLQAMGQSHGQHTSWEDSIFCEQHTARIPARSRARLAFTYRPVRSGLFAFYIFAKVQALTTLSNDEAALLRLAGNDVTVVQEHIAQVSFLPLSATIHARAAFPKVVFDDIRTDADVQISRVDHLWGRFNLSELNHDLSTPLTPSEIKLYNASSLDTSQLPVYKFAFAPAVLHTVPQVITVRLSNPGYLETRFSLALPNAKTLELENWCDEDEPSEELNRLICIIEELRLFSIEPHQGVLAPGESCLIAFTYRHSSLRYNGLHNIPIVVKLSQGRQFVVDLTGRTLAPPVPRRGSVRIVDPRASTVSIASGRVTSAPIVAAANLPDVLLVVPSAAHTGKIRLQPVPTGLSPAPHTITTHPAGLLAGSALDPAPRQRLEVVNVSAHSITYNAYLRPLSAVDGSALDPEDEFIKKTHLLEVCRIANPQGTIPAGGSVYLEIFFFPLHAKEYTLPLTIAYCATVLENNSLEGSLASATPSVTGLRSKSNRASRSREGKSRERASTQDFGPPPTPAPPVMYYLAHTLVSLGYDPRTPLPAPKENAYLGGAPPRRPLLMPYPVHLFEDVVHYGALPRYTTAHRLITLRNPSSSTAFDFAVDESSSYLAAQGMLVVQPVFGRLHPLSSVTLNLALTTYSSACDLSDCLKIMVKEVVRTSQRSRGGARAALLEKIKARKGTKSPHESVVSRATFSRSMQLVGRNLPMGIPDDEEDEEMAELDASARLGYRLTATEGLGDVCGRYPTTLSSGGAIVQSTAPAYLLAHLPAAPSGGTNVLQVSGPSSPGGTEGMGELADSGSQLSQGSRSLSPSRSASRAGGSPGRGAATPGSGTMSRGLSTGAHSSGGGGAVARIGMTFQLLLRIQGSILGDDTLARLLPCSVANHLGQLDPDTQKGRYPDFQTAFVFPRGPRDFIPTSDQNYFDEAFQASRKVQEGRSRVNVSFINDRDAELRDVCGSIFQSLAQSLIQQHRTKACMLSTLSGTDPSDGVTLCARPALGPFTQQGTNKGVGIYFQEVAPVQPLHATFCDELTRDGLLRGSSATLRLEVLRDVCNAWGLVSAEMTKALDIVEQSASANLRASFSSSVPTNLTAASVTGSFEVDLKHFVWEVLNAAGRRQLVKCLDDRQAARLGRQQRAEVLPLLLEERKTASVPEEVLDGKFGEAAAHVMSAMMFDLLQQMVCPPKVPEVA